MINVFSIVVDRHEKVLAVRDGQVVEVLGPGRHRRRRHTVYERVDVRPQLTTISPQEILTADGATVKVSASVRWQVADLLAYTAVQDAEAVVYLAVQIALRDALTVREVAEVVRDGRRDAGPAVLDAAYQAGALVGIVVDDVVIKDIVLPHELRAAYAELLTTRQRGQAQLEAARAESAALRSLANAAKVLEDHPALERLRLVQAASYGSKLVLGLDTATRDS